MTISQRLLNRFSAFLLLLSLPIFSQYRNWSILDQIDTLTLFAGEQCAGNIISSTKSDEIHKKIVVHLNYAFDESVSGMKLTEMRTYDFDGFLKEVKQTLSSASGTTKWELQKINDKHWTCKTTAGGKSEIVTVDSVKDNLIAEYDIIKKIREKKMKIDDVFIDTIFDVMSRQNFDLKTKCVKIPDKRTAFYEFELQDSKMGKSERWVVDSIGRTIEQDVPPVFIAKRKKCNESENALEIVDLWDMFKVAVSPCFQQVVLKLTSPQVLPSSVEFLYHKNNIRTYSLNKFDTSGVYEIRNANIDSWLTKSITIQSDNKKIKVLANKNAGTVRDRLLIVKNLTFFVYKYLDKRAVGTFSNALETLEAKYGDCGEHAVLLAALLRAVNVPANVVLGLVTIPGKEGYFYHAWVAVPLNDGMIFADAALGNAPATSGYIPLALDPDGRGAVELTKLVGNISIECE